MGERIRISKPFDQEGEGLSHVCRDSAIIRAFARVLGPMKPGPCTGVSFVGASVRTDGRFPSVTCHSFM